MTPEEREAKAVGLEVPTKRPPKGTDTKKRRHFRVENVDLGDGHPVTVWFIAGPTGVEVRRVGSRRRWFVPIREAARRLGIVGQVRDANRGST